MRIPLDMPNPLGRAYRALRDQPSTKRNSSRTHSAAALSLYMALPDEVREALRDFVLLNDSEPLAFDWTGAMPALLDALSEVADPVSDPKTGDDTGQRMLTIRYPPRVIDDKGTTEQECVHYLIPVRDASASSSSKPRTAANGAGA